MYIVATGTDGGVVCSTIGNIFAGFKTASFSGEDDAADHDSTTDGFDVSLVATGAAAADAVTATAGAVAEDDDEEDEDDDDEFSACSMFIRLRLKFVPNPLL